MGGLRMQWEYMIEANLYNHVDLVRLNKQGEEGWELCGVFPSNNGLSFVYKRQKPQHV
jgi:hypothetical protein